jgi:acyl-CoA dehydrogenase
MDATDPAGDLLEMPLFDDEHRELVGDLEQTVRKQLLPLDDDETDERDLARQIVDVLGDEGWLEYAVPEAYGGRHETLDVRSIALVRETLARHWGLTDFSFALQGLGSGPISLFGTDAQQERYLPAVARGDAIPAFALSEREAGSDVASLEAEAERDGDEFVLDGEKTWISNASIADFYVVFARTGEAPGAKGVSAFVVESDNPGVEFVESIETISPHPLGTIAFDECRIPAERQLAGPGDGFKVAMATLDIFRATVAAAATGFARTALEETLVHVQTRSAFDGKLADFQMTKADLAEMATELDAARLLVYRAAWKKDAGADRVTREASMAKLYATEKAQDIVDRAVQLFGARGVVSGSKIEKLYRDVRPLRIYEGASEIQKIVIARQLLGD